MRGGYQIIDLLNEDLTTEGGITIKDAYTKCLSGKPILLENVKISGIVIPAMFTFIVGDETAVMAVITFTDGTNVFNGILKITNENVITFSFVKQGEKFKRSELK